MKILLILSFFYAHHLSAQEKTTSDFLNLCKVSLSKTKEHEEMCTFINQKFFQKMTNADISPLKPTDVNAPQSPIDSKIQFIIFNDPNYLAGVAYCYFVFKNWILPNSLSPDTFGMSVSGFSILNEDIKQYQQWLSKDQKGLNCKMLVEKESEVQVVNLEDSLKNYAAIIGLNPFAIIKTEGATTESVLNEMKITINHERIHAYQVICPEFEKWSIKEWEKLPLTKKNEYIKKYTSYNWSVPKIAGREYIAYLYESNPEKITDFVKGCKIK